MGLEKVIQPPSPPVLAPPAFFCGVSASVLLDSTHRSLKKVLTQEKIVIIYLCPPQLPLLPPQRSRAQFASLKWPSAILCHLAQHWAAEQSREQMAELNKYILAQKGLSSPKRGPSGNDCSWLYAFKNNHHTGECELRTQFPHPSAVAITLHWMRQCIPCWWQKVYMAIVVCIEMAPIGSYTWMLGH